MLEEFQLDIRVRYNETDGQARVHHAQYLNYFERGRVEMLRASGFSYKELEQSGLMLVVSQIKVRYLLPAEFDDELKLMTVFCTLEARGWSINISFTAVQIFSSRPTPKSPALTGKARCGDFQITCNARRPEFGGRSEAVGCRL